MKNLIIALLIMHASILSAEEIFVYKYTAEIMFDTGSFDIKENEKSKIKRFYERNRNVKDSNIEIKGYASKSGEISDNLILSEKRAESVKRILIDKYNVSNDSIFSKGLGVPEVQSENEKEDQKVELTFKKIIYK